MANFNTHLFAAAAAGAAISAAGVKTHIFDLADTPLFFALVLVGGILPDIDAGNSKPAKLLFKLLAHFSAWGTVLALYERFPAKKLLLFGAGVYLLVRYPVAVAFNALTLHRGLIHSILAATFFSLLLVWGGHHWLHWPAYHAWLGGICLGTGFIVHLLLDEIYSVDLANRRMKKSFGTALKLYRDDTLILSSLLGLCTWLLYKHAPQAKSLLPVLCKVNWSELLQRFNSFCPIEHSI